MHRYDADRFDPPAPLAEVTLSDPATGARCDRVRMLIDTGADISVVPRSAVSQLALSVEQAAQYEVAGFGEGRSTLPAIDLRMTFLGHNFRGQFLVVEQDHGILGRNVLNAVRIHLDGPARTWREAPP